MAAALFAYLGLDAANKAAREPGFDSSPGTDETVPRISQEERPIQIFVARSNLARRNHFTRGPLSRIEEVLAAAVAGLMRAGLADLSFALRHRLL